MAMAVSLFFAGLSKDLYAFVGYEDGSVVLWRCLDGEGKRNGKSCGGSDVDDSGAAAAAAAAAPAPRALSSLRIHFDAVTAVIGTASQRDFAGMSSGGPLRFFSGGADSVLASYLVQVATPSSSPSSPSLSLSPGPAAKLPARGVGALAVLQQRSEDGGGGTLVVAGGWDGAIRLLSLRDEGEKESHEEESREENDETVPPSSPLSLEPLGELEHHVAPIAALTFDASGELLASGGRDGSIALWGLGALV